jgi:ferredoxin/flavodoxin
MKIPIIYFSASGNTKYIAQLIRNGLKYAKLDPELIPIKSKKAKSLNLKNTEVFGIGAPIYAMAFTLNMEEWVEALPIAKKPTRFFLFDTNAGIPGEAIKHMRRILEQKNYIFIGALEIIAPTRDSVFETNLFKYVKWSRRNIDKAFQFGAKIGNIIKTGKGKLDWSRHTIFGGLIRPFFKVFEKTFYKQLCNQIGFNANKCDKCKVCEKICPREAITYKDKPEFEKSLCMGCFSCLRNCPTQALYLKLMPKANYFKGPKTVKGYIPPDDVLNEYITKTK